MSTVKNADVRAAGLRRGYTAGTVASVRRAAAALSWAARLALVFAAGAVGFIGAYAAGYSPLLGATVVVSGLVFVGLLTAAPEAVKVALVLLAYVPFAAMLGFTYTSLAWGISPLVGDAAGGAVALEGMLLALSVAALRFSRGSAWVTSVWVAVMSLIPGLMVAYTFPSLGVWAAWLPMAVVAALRMGVWPWAMSFLAARHEVSSRGSVPKPLRHLPGYVVRLVKSPDGYAAVTSAGVAGVVVVKATGPATENRRDGVTIPGVPDLPAAGLKAIRAARAAARLAGLPRQRVPALLVVHGPGNDGIDRWLGVHVQDEAGAQAAVRLIGADAFNRMAADGSWRPGRVRRRAALVSVRVGRHRIR